MNYHITAAKLKQMYGHQLTITLRDGSNAKISIPQQPAEWPRGGAEAYGLRTVFDISRSPPENFSAFLKIFKTDLREREDRTRLLIDMQLAKKSDFFSGIPFGWLKKTKLNGVEVIAHFTKMIGGPFAGGPEDFGRLRSNGRWEQYDDAGRRTFGAELAAAVAGLERARIVHGDISPGNILVGHSTSGKNICILCDYDGFHCDGVSRLPRKDGTTPCRPLGSPGYQYPELIAEIKGDSRGDADIWVKTDRFALGVAICEMIAWSGEVDALLEQEGRGQLLPDDLIVSRDISRLPERITRKFPDGFRLLEKALKAGGPGSMPGPEDWIRVLGFDIQGLGLDDKPWAYTGLPIMTIYRRNGSTRVKQQAFRLRNKKADFGAISPYFRHELVDSKLELTFRPNLPLKRRRGGRLADINPGIAALFGNPGDIYYIAEWEFEISEEAVN